MISDLTDLVTVLEEEIALGEELKRNLGEQKSALIAWDIGTLIARIEARAPWLRTLAKLEERRQSLLSHGEAQDKPITLSRVIAECHAQSPIREQLKSAQGRACALFKRLEAEEHNLNRLMQDLYSHIESALCSLAGPANSRYGISGSPESQRAPSALLHHRA